MISFIMRIKLKVLLFLGTACLGTMILSTCLNIVLSIVTSPKPKEQRLISEMILSDIKKGANVAYKNLEFTLPILLWWTPFSSIEGIKVCNDKSGRAYRCYFSHNRSFKEHPKTSAIMFYGTDFSILDLPFPRHYHEDWALIHEESPKNNPLISQDSIIRMFNHTATFRSQSDVPLTLQYLDNLDIITDETFMVPVDMKNELIKTRGLGLVAYVQSSCDTPSGRDEYVSELMKHVQVDSYGYCLHNKDLPPHLRDPSTMKDPDFLHILAQYKFVLAIENAVCEDYITEKLWKALHIGSVPIYFGAPNVRDWLPNEESAIHVEEFNSAKELAQYLAQLHQYEEEYKRYLLHKPSYNDNHLSLVTNDRLIRAVSQRSWGVSEQAQLALGNFVERFECLVCSRVARNVEMTMIGFGKMPYNANEDHYGCPAPVQESGGTLSNAKSRWWDRQWNQAHYEGQVLEEFMQKKVFNYTKSQFYDRVLEVIKEDNMRLFNNVKKINS